MSVDGPPKILSIGETLFDGLPSGIFLGGAPLNVAAHVARMGARATYVSSVGNDRLGIEARRRLETIGVNTSLVAVDKAAETGFVSVDIDANGDATYEFATPSAWDSVPEKGVAEAAASADALVFGTLSQRAEKTRATVAAARAAAQYVVCDANLRPPYDSEEIVGSSVCGVDFLKLSDEELVPVSLAVRSHWRSCATCEGGKPRRWDAACEAAEAADKLRALADGSTDVDVDAAAEAAAATAAAALGKAAHCSCVVVTRGERGAVMWEKCLADADSSEAVVLGCAGFVAPAVADTVGAGDAFLAALLVRKLGGASAEEALEAGCRLGAFVAGMAGATPAHDEVKIGELKPRGKPKAVVHNVAYLPV